MNLFGDAGCQPVNLQMGSESEGTTMTENGNSVAKRKTESTTMTTSTSTMSPPTLSTSIVHTRFVYILK